MGRFAWQYSLLLSVMLIASLLPRDLEAGGGPPCQQPIASRYCSSTQLDMLVPQEGRAKVFLEQLIRAYQPELLDYFDPFEVAPVITDQVKDFHQTCEIGDLVEQELGTFVRNEHEEIFRKGEYLTQTHCYGSGDFSNLNSYYDGLKMSNLEPDKVRYLAMLRLVLVQSCLFNLDDYMKSSVMVKELMDKEQSAYKNWFQYIEAAALYHDGFFPEAADRFSVIALAEKTQGRKKGWLIETARYMEILALFHNGREGQEEIFLPAIFNSFTEAFLMDYPQSEYRRHVMDMEAGIWLHYGDRDRYYAELLKSVSLDELLTSDVDSVDQLDRLAINALLANIGDIATHPLKHRDGITLLAAILSKPEDVESLCLQTTDVVSAKYEEISRYSVMVCEYLLEGEKPSGHRYKGTPLYSHALAFEAMVNLEQGEFNKTSMLVSSLLAENVTSLEDIFALRTKQLEARLKNNAALAFILEDSITDVSTENGHFSELRILDTVLYEQVSRYFLSTNDFISAFSGTDSPLLKFALIRPHLDEAMIQEDWRGAVLLSQELNWQKVLQASALQKSSKLREEIELYVELQNSLTSLASGKATEEIRAKALSDVAYFLYENHIAPRCSYARTRLVESYLDGCKRHYIHLTAEDVWAENTAADQPRAPIEMFEEALGLYGNNEGTTAARARLLRIMLFCAKGANNVSYCLRWKDIPKKQFQSWFETLALKYPKSERVKYWYYDLPFYTGVYINRDGQELDQEYWYEEDAYLGYLDGGPYDLNLH